MISSYDCQLPEKRPVKKISLNQSNTSRVDKNVHVKFEANESLHDNPSTLITSDTSTSLQYDVPEPEVNYSSNQVPMPKLPDPMGNSHGKKWLKNNMPTPEMSEASDLSFNTSSSRDEQFSVMTSRNDVLRTEANTARKIEEVQVKHRAMESSRQITPELIATRQYDEKVYHRCSHHQSVPLPSLEKKCEIEVQESEGSYHEESKPCYYPDRYLSVEDQCCPSSYYSHMSIAQGECQNSSHFVNQVGPPSFGYYYHQQKANPGKGSLEHRDIPGACNNNTNHQYRVYVDQYGHRCFLPLYTQPANQGETYVMNLNKNDVLCGRGGTVNTYIGNRSFRALVAEYQGTYLLLRKKEKPKLISEVIAQIRSRGGRFLERHEIKESGLWKEVGYDRATAKTGQAMREGLAGIRKQMRKKKDNCESISGYSIHQVSKRKCTDSKEAWDESKVIKKMKLSSDIQIYAISRRGMKKSEVQL